MRWALNVDNFTVFDRLKIAAFILNRDNRLTMGPKVAEFEAMFGDYAKSKALFVSSGSTANTLLVETYKQLKGLGTVIVPTTTWSTSINPWIQAGYDIRFCDVNSVDFSLNLTQLEKLLHDVDGNVIVFPTSLIGWVPKMDELRALCEEHGATLFMDNCENTFGRYHDESLLSLTTCTTSTYFGHHLSSIEGGFLFTQDEEFYQKAKMIRNHGMSRSLDPYNPTEGRLRLSLEIANNTIDPQFLFVCLGSNYRNTEINALFGMCDFKRKDKYIARRRDIYGFFFEQIDHERYLVPELNSDYAVHVPFCLPLICKEKDDLADLKLVLQGYGIEYRPIVGGNLLAQPIYQKYAEGVEQSVSRMIHNRGLYVGLHPKVGYGDINMLCHIANNL